MLAAAFSYRLPAPGWKPAGWVPPDDAHRAKRMISAHNVHIDEALKTRQFYQLWIVLCFNVTAGIGVHQRRAHDDDGDLRHDLAHDRRRQPSPPPTCS